MEKHINGTIQESLKKLSNIIVGDGDEKIWVASQPLPEQQPETTKGNIAVSNSSK